MRTGSGLYIPGAPIAAGVGTGPIGYTRRGRAVWPIAGGSMTAASVRASQRTEGGPAARGQQQQVLVPFVRGSREFVEGPFVDTTVTPGAGAVAVNPVDVPARGWATAIVLQVTATLGVIGAGVLGEDWPFSVFDQLALTRPNGDPYFGPMSGFSAFVAGNLYGGFEFEADPRANPDYLGGINCRFMLRIPLEITHHDAYGALINQDAAASYKLQWTVPASTTLFTTAVGTIPALRYRAWLEGWEQPKAADLAGNPIAQSPPGTPTAQFLSEQTFQVVAGLNTIRLTDVGNLIRVLSFVYRDDTAPRSRAIGETELPADLRLTYDARDLENRSLLGWRDVMFKRYGFAHPNGVVVYDKIHDGEGHAGNEARNQYLPTSDATRIELVGTWTGTGGTLTVITNDVAPAGVPVS